MNAVIALLGDLLDFTADPGFAAPAGAPGVRVRPEHWLLIDDTGRIAGAQSREPGPEWTRIEAVVEGGKLTYYVNGKLVNAASDSSFKDGRIMIQSEGAEIYFRRIELQPLK